MDNSDDTDILNFYVKGLAAPSGRFNYVFTELEQKAVSAEDRSLLSETTVIKPGARKAVIRGGVMSTYEANSAYGVQTVEGELYFPTACLSDALGYGTTKVIYESDRNFLKIDTKGGNYELNETQYKAFGRTLFYIEKPVAARYLKIDILSTADDSGKVVDRHATANEIDFYETVADKKEREETTGECYVLKVGSNGVSVKKGRTEYEKTIDVAPFI